MNNEIFTKSFFVILGILLAVLTWQGQRIVGMVDKISSSLTGHLIQHGKSDYLGEGLVADVKKLKRNQRLICRYEEPQWASGDRCDR